MSQPSTGSGATVIPFVDEGLGNSSYLVDLGDGSALVVDPVRDPTSYLAIADQRGLRIRFAADTHIHADFVSGGRELAATGATYIAPARGELEFPHLAVDDGAEMGVGGLTLEVMATPGHTPEHVSYVLVDDRRPVAAFTGGALIVGSIARTDLISPEATEALTREAYRSVRRWTAALPADVAIYPTHGGGSFCSVSSSDERTTTLARERRTNPILTTPSEDTFVESFLGGLGSYPPYFLRTQTVNRRGPTIGAHRRELPALEPSRVHALRRDGAIVVDARPFDAFSATHIRDSISIELRPQFASWLGWVVPADAPLIFVLEEDQDRADLMRQCLKIGYEHLAGELEGGIAGWIAAGYDVATFDLVEPGARSGTLVDVRQSSELRSGAIPGSVHVEAGSIAVEGVPAGPLTLYCGHGQRATTAASLLEREGATDLSVLVGGPDDWTRATGEPLERTA